MGCGGSSLRTHPLDDPQVLADNQIRHSEYGIPHEWVEQMKQHRDGTIVVNNLDAKPKLHRAPEVARDLVQTPHGKVDADSKVAQDHVHRLVSTAGPALARYHMSRDFYEEHTALVETVRKWEAGETDTLFVDEAAGEVAEGALPASLPQAMRGKPIFQCFVEDVESGRKCLAEAFPTILYSDARCLAFIPAGFRGSADHDARALQAYAASDGSRKEQQQLVNEMSLMPLTMNPTSLNQGHGASLMSLVHVLVIPRKRLYNAVTLKPEDAELVRHMQDVGRASVRALLRADGRDEGGGTSSLTTVPSTLAELSATTYLPGGLSLGEQPAKSLGGSGWVGAPETTFHVYPQQTIGWLHLHVTCAALRTAAYAHMDSKARQKDVGGNAGFPKNIRAEDILSDLLQQPAPSLHPLQPVNIYDLIRAERAVILIQMTARTRLQRTGGKMAGQEENEPTPKKPRSMMLGLPNLPNWMPSLGSKESHSAATAAPS